jgi:hypothetical protein
MSRVSYLMRFQDHPFLSRDFKKLNEDEISYLKTFIKDHDELSFEEWAIKVNRTLFDSPKIRKSNRVRSWALLLEAVSSEHIERKTKTQEQKDE